MLLLNLKQEDEYFLIYSVIDNWCLQQSCYLHKNPRRQDFFFIQTDVKAILDSLLFFSVDLVLNL